ncbi:MAG: hypothetical protein DWQ07_21710 [Chloroflexi bacterium]|nr:MAG: hypothetical protein DWQ07_21710 [Chloroflexota bacterium]MBL1197332.1 hypothetical protein [Chloroflexota bacterium]NOH14627.1 hypothetical protein [Chloroflexota bacterium]
MAKAMRRLGWWLFTLMWCPFTLIFVSMFTMDEMGGGFARTLANFLDGIYPGLGSAQVSVFPVLGVVSFVLTFAIMLLAIFFLVGASIFSGARNRALLSTGALASARILSADQTGTTVNDNPVVRFTLEVYPSNGEAFEAETEKLVSMFEIMKYQEGNTVAVRYDPNTKAVAITEETVTQMGGESSSF